MSLLATTIIFALLYRLHPRGHVNWSDAFTAAAIASVFWEVARQLLAVVLTSGRYSAYGVVGSFLAVMVGCTSATASSTSGQCLCGQPNWNVHRTRRRDPRGETEQLRPPFGNRLPLLTGSKRICLTTCPTPYWHPPYKVVVRPHPNVVHCQSQSGTDVAPSHPSDLTYGA